MKKFVELIQRVHNERFSVVINKIAAEKIPVAFLSLAPIDAAVAMVKNLRGQGLNISKLVTLHTPPLADSELDFDIIHLNDVAKIQPRPEYVLTLEDIGYNFADLIAIRYLPYSKTIHLERGSSEVTYQIFMSHLTDLQRVYGALIDEESKKTFCGYWLGCITNRLGDLVHSNDMHYLTAGFIPQEGAVVIDGGAFDGGTATVFSKMGYKVYAFELDKKNFEMAKKVAAENNFVIENFGLGSYPHEMNYNPLGSASSIRLNGSEKAQITTIDTYIREHAIPRVDFIKLDVEGAELDVLKGAKTSIARYKPILAISAYHRTEDFWVLTDFIKSIRPDYEFAIRHYASYAQDDIPSEYTNELQQKCTMFGLEPAFKNWWECCILAR